MNQGKKNCKNCGYEMECDSNFCTQCGAKYESSTNQNNSLNIGNNTSGKFFSTSDMNRYHHDINYSGSGIPSINNVESSPKDIQLDMHISNSNVSGPVQKNKMNKNAIYSIICSCISIFIFWWLALVGIGLGVNALREVKCTNEKGKVLAVISIAIGAVSLLLYYYFNIFKK